METVSSGKTSWFIPQLTKKKKIENNYLPDKCLSCCKDNAVQYSAIRTYANNFKSKFIYL